MVYLDFKQSKWKPEVFTVKRFAVHFKSLPQKFLLGITKMSLLNQLCNWVKCYLQQIIFFIVFLLAHFALSHDFNSQSK